MEREWTCFRGPHKLWSVCFHSWFNLSFSEVVRLRFFFMDFLLPVLPGGSVVLYSGCSCICIVVIEDYVALHVTSVVAVFFYYNI